MITHTVKAEISVEDLISFISWNEGILELKPPGKFNQNIISLPFNETKKLNPHAI